MTGNLYDRIECRFAGALGRMVFGATNVLSQANTILRQAFGIQSPSLAALGRYVDPRIAEITPYYEPRRPRWYAAAHPLPCSVERCRGFTCRHARPAHADRAERKRARRAAR